MGHHREIGAKLTQNETKGDKMTKARPLSAITVARAIVKASPLAGIPIDLSLEDWESGNMPSDEERARNLVERGYVKSGDHNGWAPGGRATVFCEQHGGEGDCHVPFDFYEGGLDRSFEASVALKEAGVDGFFEWANAAVLGVYS